MRTHYGTAMTPHHSASQHVDRYSTGLSQTVLSFKPAAALPTSVSAPVTVNISSL
jgi:hypothetical protein